MPHIPEHAPKVSTRSVYRYARESLRKRIQQDRQTDSYTDGLSKTTFLDFHWHGSKIFSFWEGYSPLERMTLDLPFQTEIISQYRRIYDTPEFHGSVYRLPLLEGAEPRKLWLVEETICIHFTDPQIVHCTSSRVRGSANYSFSN